MARGWRQWFRVTLDILSYNPRRLLVPLMAFGLVGSVFLDALGWNRRGLGLYDLWALPTGLLVLFGFWWFNR